MYIKEKKLELSIILIYLLLLPKWLSFYFIIWLALAFLSQFIGLYILIFIVFSVNIIFTFFNWKNHHIIKLI